MIIKILKKIFSIILIVLGSLVFIFVEFIYGRASWLDTNAFQINTSLVVALSVFIFLLGLISLLKSTTGLFNSLPKALFIIRKIFAVFFLGNLLYVLFYAHFLGLFLWLMFFNVALIFCLYLLLTKHNGYFFGIFFFLLGLAYAFIPIFPGPTVWMKEYYSNPAVVLSEGGDKILLLQIIVVKISVALSGCFILLAAFLKNTPLKNIEKS